jgi:hypothetical protein
MEGSSMVTRRNFITGIAAGAGLALLAAPALAAAPAVEIIALPHWPVQNALKPVRDFLKTLGARVKVTELDAESPAGEKRITAVGLKGHVPILLIVNGSDRYKRPDGTQVLFKDFPAGAGNPLGLNGSWSVADFEAAVKAALGK